MTNWRSAYDVEKARRIKAEREAKAQRAAKYEARKQLESERQKTEKYRKMMREWDSSLQRKYDDIRKLMGRILETKMQIRKQWYGQRLR